MPLKILLADDSATIKKVVQLSLQDFGVEVKSISSGKDVLDVARSFNPDIAFIDVLLPHKTGYEVAAEMKKDGQLKGTPIVMMWSAFMSLDEDKFKESGAEDRLEKPFEVSGLRQLVTKYVSKTQTNPISKHVDFPTLDFDDEKIIKKGPTAAKETPAEGGAGSENWSMSSFEDINQFASSVTAVEGAGSSGPELGAKPQGWPDETEWVRKDISKFKVNIPEEGTDDSLSFEVPEGAIETSSFLKGGDKPSVSEAGAQLTKPEAVQPPPPEVHAREPEAPAPTIAPIEQVFEAPAPQPQTAQIAPQANAVVGSAMSEEDIRKFITQEVERLTKEVIEKVVWQSVPEIATNLIKEELKRLLETENPPL